MVAVGKDPLVTLADGMGVSCLANVAESFLTAVTDFLWAVGLCLWEPLARTPWTDWHGFWIPWVFVNPDGRYPVYFFLPLALLLLAFPRRHVRGGIIVTGLLFMGYVFGAAFPVFWVLVCAAFYRLSERFAVEARRRDVLQIGPPLAAAAIIAIWFTVANNLHHLRLPAELNAWLFQHWPWVFPLGFREFLPWESYSLYLGQRIGLSGVLPPDPAAVAARPPPLFYWMFFSPQTCGLVMLTIRMISYFSELKRDTIPRQERSFWNFLAYNSFGPVFLMGPIERYADFQANLRVCHERRGWRDVGAGLWRLAVGLGKCLFVVLYLARPVLDFAPRLYLRPESISDYPALFFGVHWQMLGLYLLFSGYSDAAVGLARLVGYRATENFRRPYLACNLTDMWRRWHISLSFVLRDYVFLPLVRRRWRLLPSLLLTFFLCGLLHNYSLAFVLWGLVMGVMVWVSQRWGRAMRALERHPERLLARVRRVALSLQPLPRLCAWFITINAFCLSGLICFGGPRGFVVVWELLRRPALRLAEVCGWWS